MHNPNFGNSGASSASNRSSGPDGADSFAPGRPPLPIRDALTEVHELEPVPGSGHREATQLHNAGATAELFLRAALAGLPPSFRRGDSAEGWAPTLFSMGGIAAAVGLSRLPERAKHRIERRFLRDRFGLGRVASWRLQNQLHRRALTPMGQEMLQAGRRALAEWLHGDDPSWRLQQLIRSSDRDRTPPRARHHGRRAAPSLHSVH